ncbi:Leucine rich repeat-containing protein, partial [Prevotellaceae bacterium HUN156]
LLSLMLLPLVASAQVNIGGIYYELNSESKTAEVVSMSTGKYTGDIVIPMLVSCDNIQYSVTSIGESAFKYCSGLTSVTIGNSVTSIGYSAFYGCSGLTSVTIPNSVTSIGDSAFRGCSGLTSVIIPNSVTSIGDRAFSGCSGLTSVTSLNPIPPTIDSNTFNPYTAVLIVLKGCKAAYQAANYWRKFTNIEEISENTVVIDDVWYELNSESKTAEVVSTPLGEYTGDIVIPMLVNYENIQYSVTSIGDEAFLGCSRLTSVTIGNSVTSIGEDAFLGCYGLTSISVENGNTVYDSRNDCKAIIETESNTLILGCANTIIPNSVTSIGEGAFSDCSGLTSVTIPNSVTSIGNGAFSYCSGLTSITIPNSVTSIGRYAFRNCSGLTSITIGNSVTGIGDHAFLGCSCLTSITSLNPIPPTIDTSTFYYYLYYTAVLNVPIGSKAAYQADYYWWYFTNIEEIDVAGVQGIQVDKDQNAMVYDLNGRRLNAPTKGVGIINGRKVLMK